MAVLALLFLVVPIVELAVIIQVGGAIGVWNTLGLLVLMSVVGGWLMKQQGLGILRRVQRTISRGGVPTTDLVDGFLVVFGGALMLTPGFLTDILGMSLLLPPVRSVVRRMLRRRFAAMAVRTGGSGATGVIDL